MYIRMLYIYGGCMHIYVKVHYVVGRSTPVIIWKYSVFRVWVGGWLATSGAVISAVFSDSTL